MVKMKTPKIKEVKKHFKNADEIVSLMGRSFKNDNIFRKSRNIGDLSVYAKDGIYEVWSPEQGYAKILSYKEPKITAIAMRCNQEQFDKIRPKLKKAELVLGSCILNESWPYLINHYHDDDLDINKPSIGSYVATRDAKEIYEEWNEKVFLKACGIKVKEPKEKTYKITKSQVLELYDGKFTDDKDEMLKEWFPDAFKTELVAGRWYKDTRIDSKALFYLEEITPHETIGMKSFGFTMNGGWTESCNRSNAVFEKFIVEATEQEVTEALIKEVKKRYKAGDYVEKIHRFSNKYITGNNPGIVVDSDYKVWYGGCIVFKDGHWAEIIPTLTIQEAEAKLNAKIV